MQENLDLHTLKNYVRLTGKSRTFNTSHKIIKKNLLMAMDLGAEPEKYFLPHIAYEQNRHVQD